MKLRSFVFLWLSVFTDWSTGLQAESNSSSQPTIAEKLASIQPDHAYQLASGPFKVKTIDDLPLDDAKRQRVFPVKIFYPDAAGQFPVILFSHGLGGNKNGFGYLSEFWASHGYVVIHPSHDDSTALQRQREGTIKKSPLREKTGPAKREPTTVVDLTKGSRTRDLSFILDSIELIANLRPELAGRLNANQIGVAGHSAGAFTTLQMGGLDSYMIEGANPINVGDSRVKAIMPISARGIGPGGMTEKSCEKIMLPMMLVTGSLDDGEGYFGGQTVERRKDAFRHSLPGDKYLLFIEGATHSSFGGWRREKQGAAQRVTETDVENIKACMKTATLAFWDAYLKGSEAGKKSIEPETFRRFANLAAHIEAK